MRKQYTTVSIPEELALKIDKMLEDDEWGYRSRAELIAEATRHHILRLIESSRG